MIIYHLFVESLDAVASLQKRNSQFNDTIVDCACALCGSVQCMHIFPISYIFPIRFQSKKMWPKMINELKLDFTKRMRKTWKTFYMKKIESSILKTTWWTLHTWTVKYFIPKQPLHFRFLVFLEMNGNLGFRAIQCQYLDAAGGPRKYLFSLRFHDCVFQSWKVRVHYDIWLFK